MLKQHSANTNNHWIDITDLLRDIFIFSQNGQSKSLMVFEIYEKIKTIAKQLYLNEIHNNKVIYELTMEYVHLYMTNESTQHKFTSIAEELGKTFYGIQLAKNKSTTSLMTLTNLFMTLFEYLCNEQESLNFSHLKYKESLFWHAKALYVCNQIADAINSFLL